MKPFLGINVTENTKNELMNGEEFIFTKASEEKLEALESASAELELYEKRSKLPLPIRIVNYALGFAAALIVLSIFSAFRDSDGGLTLAKAYGNAPYLFWIAGISGIAFIAISLVAMLRKRHILGSEEARAAMIRANMAGAAAKAELNLPVSTPMIDVLTFKYKIGKDGKIAPKTAALASSPYFALEMFAFRENGELRLADYEQVWAFPFDELTGITRVNKNIVIPNRGKEIIKQYKDTLTDFKMTTSDNGLIVKPYYVLNVNHMGEQYGIYFPCYSLPTIKELTGLSPEDGAPDENPESEEAFDSSDFDMPSDN